MTKHTLKEKVDVWYKVINMNKRTMRQSVSMAFKGIVPLMIMIIVLVCIINWLLSFPYRRGENVLGVFIFSNIFFAIILAILSWYLLVKIILHKALNAIDANNKELALKYTKKYVKLSCKRYPNYFAEQVDEIEKTNL
ncbi:hypothetical protein [Mycoplasma tauri]|uniref:Uncharacterized protein n=1 Tax=Mycoplasma tauri TaxID=547987 RepID=A0A953NEL6_9MOLU|nr:hypothetical protein [Mycoplasma tauri]MBZ4195518.1 hypothetical protein [Mycoplasma tauri]MBZ4203740.1 hypothetical protein [Mycoplasma tauri]MBZ4204315.1 hypothetical protein [Mycoplasma tauri]MBZ4212842.1 hypothetical protein [Mycoplasma tauri]MBZ4218373.1 hypothetical protein [Mycoplasma tauri]